VVIHVPFLLTGSVRFVAVTDILCDGRTWSNNRVLGWCYHASMVWYI